MFVIVSALALGHWWPKVMWSDLKRYEYDSLDIKHFYLAWSWNLSITSKRNHVGHGVYDHHMMTSSNGNILRVIYWPFVRWIHRSPVNSPHKGQWRGALMFSLICSWINGWSNNVEAGDLRWHRAQYDVIVMNPRKNTCLSCLKTNQQGKS